MVDRCLDILAAATLTKAEHVTRTSENIFLVTSQTHAGMSYLVNLCLPSCTCYNFGTHIFPCKHIFAVLTHNNLTFSDLPESYTNSVWLTLDDMGPAATSDDKQMDSNIPSGNLTVQKISLPTHDKKHGLHATCRELIQEINALTFSLDGGDLQWLKDYLSEGLSHLKPTGLIPRESSRTTTRKRTRKNTVSPL